MTTMVLERHTTTEDGGATPTAALVRRAREGDVAAFEGLYRRTKDRVYALCLRLSADPQRAEELTQDVYVRVWEKLDRFEGRSAFTTWLHRLAVNVVLGEKRSEAARRKRVVAVEDPVALERPSGMPSPGRGLDLERAIATLPDGARTIFVLHDVEGYKHDEIAEMNGIAVGTSKAQLHRARRLLRERLER